MHFEIPPGAKRMASAAARILLFTLLGTLVAPRRIHAQSFAAAGASANDRYFVGFAGRSGYFPARKRRHQLAAAVDPHQHHKSSG